MNIPKKQVDVIINEEYLKVIRSFVAIRPEEQFEYVPKVFRSLPVELQPRFTLQPISGEDILRYSDSMRGEVHMEDGKAQIQVKRGEFTISVVKRGLKGWYNFYDIHGSLIDFKENQIGNLSPDLLEELSEAIMSRAKLTDEELLGLK